MLLLDLGDVIILLDSGQCLLGLC